MTDEPRFTKAQVEEAVERGLQGVSNEVVRRCKQGTMVALDSTVRSCRCGKCTWEGTHWVAPEVFVGCPSCRCALLEEGKVSEPLSIVPEFHEGPMS